MRLWKIRPNDVACSQDSIGKKFKDGQSLEETLSQLRSGQCKVDDIERIQISWHSHDAKSPGQPRWWTYTGNRRLSLFQRLEDEGCLEFIVAQWVNTPVPEWRMTTKKPGVRWCQAIRPEMSVFSCSVEKIPMFRREQTKVFERLCCRLAPV